MHPSGANGRTEKATDKIMMEKYLKNREDFFPKKHLISEI